MHESFFKMKDFYKKCNKPLQTEKSCHTFAHNQSNQINQLSNCDLFFSGFVGQGLFLPTLFFGCFLKCEISVFGMMLSVLVRVSWRMLFFSSWKCFGILGSRTWIFIFFVVSFLYIFVIKISTSQTSLPFRGWSIPGGLKPRRTFLYLDIFCVLQVL